MSIRQVGLPKPWYYDRNKVADLFWWLKDRELSLDVFADTLLRAPWKHQEDFEAMRNEEQLERLAEEQKGWEDDVRRRGAL